MPNITISGLPLATLPLDGPNSFFEVQTLEAGVTVSRKISADDLIVSSGIIVEDEGIPLATGADTLNFVGAGVVASGAGATKTITIPAQGQVDTVVGGTNINVDSGDPVNPIVNLNATVTGLTVNGVLLSDVGAATSYLDETGAYSVPIGSGGQVDSVVGGTNISVNVADPVNPIVNLDAAITGVSVDGVTLTTAGVATNYLDETGAYSVPAGGGGGVTTFEGRNGAVVALSADYDAFYLVKTGGPQTCTSDVTINGGGSLTIDDNFTNFRLENSTDLLMFSSGGTEDFRISLSASLCQFTGSGFNPPDLSLQIQNWVGLDVNVQTFFQPSLTVGGSSNPGSGASINIPHGAVPSTPVNGDVWTTTAGFFARINGVTIDLAGGLTQPITLTADIDGDGFNLDDMGVLFMREQAAADADVTGQGQIWVLDEGFTQSLMYTNDNGNDFELAALNLTDMNTSSLLVTGTAFVESLVFQPDVNRDYIVTATFELQSPAADDMQVEMVIDTNAVFKGVLTYASQDGTITGTFALESQVGDVITNIVVVPTSGNLTPDGTYVTITGSLNMGATSGTHSVRVAKNADTGADGLFVAFAALQASVLQVS